MQQRRVAVLGSGIAGLSTAYFLKKYYPDIDLQIFEQSSRPGGCINSVTQSGFLFEQGARGIVPSGKGECVLDLITELNLWEQIVLANNTCRQRYLFHAGNLQRVPPGLWRSLISAWRSKLPQALLRDWRVKPDDYPDGSVAEFLERHFSHSHIHQAFEAFLAGTRAGDIDHLSSKAVLPFLSSLESKHGSLVKGLLYSWLKNRRSSQSKYGSGVSRAAYVSFSNGLQSLPATLAEKLASYLHYNSPVRSIELSGSTYRIVCDHSTFPADIVISTIPAFALHSIVRNTKPQLALLLQKIEYVPVAVVSLGYAKNVVPLSGYGYLTTRTAQSRILGAAWNDQIFPQLPRRGSSLSVNISAARLENFHHYSREDFIRFAIEDLRAQLGIQALPIATQCHIHSGGLPQFKVGHHTLRSSIHEHSPPNFHVLGNFMQGIGIRDIVASAREFAVDLCQDLKQDSNITVPLLRVENF